MEYTAEEMKLIEIVQRYPGIAPQAAWEQGMHELHDHSRESEQRFMDGMWRLLANTDEIRFTNDRALAIGTQSENPAVQR